MGSVLVGIQHSTLYTTSVLAIQMSAGSGGAGEWASILNAGFATALTKLNSPHPALTEAAMLLVDVAKHESSKASMSTCR